MEMRHHVRRAAVAVIGALLAVAGCTGERRTTEPPPVADDAVPNIAGPTVTVVAAGDIARNPDDGRRTARLIRSIGPDALLPLGDNAYDEGALPEYRRNYDPTWGSFKAITRPIPGNHEYGTSRAAGYFAYFADQVRGRPYYAWTAGRWRLYALNCEIACGAGSAQLTWLGRDLRRHAGRPSLAYVHRPRFTCSTHHPPFPGLTAIWATLQAAHGRVMLAGHNHAYERFAKQSAGGRLHSDGLRQFVVGTGGASAYPVSPSCSHRQAAYDDGPGVLVLRLAADHFTWTFVAAGGRVIDRGRGRA